MKTFVVTLKITKWETYEVEAEDADDAEDKYGLESPVSESDEDIEVHSVEEKRA